MAITNKLRKGIHRKAYEQLAPPLIIPSTGSFIANIDPGQGVTFDDRVYSITSATNISVYSMREDAWVALPPSGIAGTFGAGSCGEAMALGMLGGNDRNTATASSTTTTLATTLTIPRRLTGCRVRVISGTGIGYQGTVSTNTLGSNSTVTVTPANTVAFDATTVFQVFSGSLWFFNAGTVAVGFAVYDRATNAWTQKSVTGLLAAFGTIGQLVGTPSTDGVFEAGTSSGTNTTTTLNHTGKTWATNCWANYQLRITAGTGIGQIRTIASNTATALTVGTAWTTTPDATSQYAIEGDDNALYLLGNGAVTLYKYSISGNAWATVTPTTARGAAIAAGGTADWIGPVDAWPVGTNTTAIGGAQQGRFIYSFRGGNTSTLDVYDIAANTWGTLAYGNANLPFSTGGCSAYDGRGRIVLQNTSNAGQRYAFDVAENKIAGLMFNPIASSFTQQADFLAVDTVWDGADRLDYMLETQVLSNVFFRLLLV